MSRAIIIQSDDWEGLYVDGELVGEDHTLCGSDLLYLVKIATDYRLAREDFTVCWVDASDEDELEMAGGFPCLLSDLKGDYL